MSLYQYIPVYTYVFMYIYIHVGMYMYICHKHIYACTYVCVCVCAHPCIHPVEVSLHIDAASEKSTKSVPALSPLRKFGGFVQLH